MPAYAAIRRAAALERARAAWEAVEEAFGDDVPIEARRDRVSAIRELKAALDELARW